MPGSDSAQAAEDRAGIHVPFTVDADLDLGRGARPWLRGPGADVRICRGPVPTELRRVGKARKNWQWGGERVLIRGPRGMRGLVESGRSIVYAVPTGTDPLDARLFLMGTPWLALAAQRGLLPLHASAVRAGGNVHAFGGADGAGKSTLVAALANRGHAYFADDSLLLDVTLATDEVRCYGCKDLKLDRTGAELANLPLGKPASARRNYGKHYVELPGGAPPAVGRLKTLSLLTSGPQPRCTLETLDGWHAMGALRESIRRRGLVAAICGKQRLADWMARLIERIEVRVLRRSMDDRHFHSTLATIAATLPQGGAPMVAANEVA